MIDVKVGNPDYTKATMVVRSETVVIHPFWSILDMARHRHDIGLIKVRKLQSKQDKTSPPKHRHSDSNCYNLSKAKPISINLGSYFS
jgi:hypothetical protein